MSNSEILRPAKRRIPYRIETERLTIRCYGPEHAPILRESVTENIEHLGEFMPWVQFEPQSLEEKIDLILGFRSAFDADTNHVMGIFAKGTDKLLGGTGFHPVGSSREDPGDGTAPMEIGYWIDAKEEGKGYVTETVKALTVVAFHFRPLERLVIRVDPANTRSEKIPLKLGYQYEGTTRRSIAFPNDTHPRQRRDAKVYSLLRHEFESADWRGAIEDNLKAWDALEQPAPLVEF